MNAPGTLVVSLAVACAFATATAASLAAPLTLEPWTGADLPGSDPGTYKYRLTLRGVPGHDVVLRAVRVPRGWVASFCTDRVCAPFKADVMLPRSGVKVVEFQLVPPAAHLAAPHVGVVAHDAARESTAST